LGWEYTALTGFILLGHFEIKQALKKYLPYIQEESQIKQALAINGIWFEICARLQGKTLIQTCGIWWD